MPRYIVRPRGSAKKSGGSVTGTVHVVAGLALGAALGTLLAELVAPAAQRVSQRMGKRPPRSVAELVHDAQVVIDGDVQLRECGLGVIPVGRNAIELHGWVSDRKSRTRAAMLVAERIAAASVINCILVRGEDDVIPFIEDPEALEA